MQPMPLAALRAVCAEPYGFWLDSALVDARLGRRSFWGIEPSLVLRSFGRRIEVERTQGTTHRFGGGPFEVLRELLAEHRGHRGGAAVGYLGYGLKQHLERLPHTVVDDLALPDCCVGFYAKVHITDARSLAPPTPPPGERWWPERWSSTFTREAYEAAVQKALEYVREGEIYQVNLSQRFRASYASDPFEAYLRLRTHTPAPFGAFLRYADFAVLSSSPERFLRYEPRGRLIETRPIKGTRPRGRDVAQDRDLAAALE